MARAVNRGLVVAGTGTFEFELASGVYNELQCGSYIFMDADYGRNLDRDGAPTKAFEPSLFVWATVMSRPTEHGRLGIKGATQREKRLKQACLGMPTLRASIRRAAGG